MTKRASDVNYTGGTNDAGNSLESCAIRDDSSEDRPITIRAAFFFDGTLNNRTNVSLGQQGVDRGESYKNFFSNIAIMEKYFKANSQYDHSFSIYVEGIGTTDEKRDNLMAAALGIGPTGVLDKVEAGIKKFINNITDNITRGAVIDRVDLDSFGFSRGAAAARNFVYKTLYEEETLKLKLESAGYTVNDVRIKFVGLYDTVASFGIDHDNDTIQLHLDAIKDAEHVVQLAAADEHRKNFPLTDIGSALQGTQLFLPGAHSDIGGGYVDNLDEVSLQIFKINTRYGASETVKATVVRERQWLLEFGWYHEDEIQNVDDWDDLKVTRRGISNHYSRIPLKVMVNHAKKRGVYFRDELLSDNEIPPSLKAVEELLMSPQSSPDYWLDLKTDLIKQLRHDFLHFSAYYGSTMGCHDPNFTRGGPVRGRRKRRINNG